MEDECTRVTHGALLLDPMTQQNFVFGDHVPPELVQSWTRHGKRQVIAQTELFPVLAAKETWTSVITGRSVLRFIDNESAKMALIRNFSPVIDSFLLLQANAKLDVENQSRNWYSRMPSKSNPSDNASRLDFSCYQSSLRCDPCYSRVFSSIREFESLVESLKVG